MITYLYVKEAVVSTQSSSIHQNSARVGAEISWNVWELASSVEIENVNKGIKKHPNKQTSSGPKSLLNQMAKDIQGEDILQVGSLTMMWL